ncbi:hypothetical protein [Nostoc sp. MG11]|nr:hypothetical protein [Nostoc sp. MG11]
MPKIESWELGELYLIVSQLNSAFTIVQFPFPHPSILTIRRKIDNGATIS